VSTSRGIEDHLRKLLVLADLCLTAAWFWRDPQRDGMRPFQLAAGSGVGDDVYFRKKARTMSS
jgi:hypothetical protein